MADGMTIRVDNLQQLRSSLNKLDKDTVKAMQLITKAAAEIVAVEARTLAPRRSGRLAGSIRATTSGARGIVRSRLPYAPVHEFGGTIAPRGTPIKIKRNRYVGRAQFRKREEVAQVLLRGYDEVLRANGWR